MRKTCDGRKHLLPELILTGASRAHSVYAPLFVRALVGLISQLIKSMREIFAAFKNKQNSHILALKIRILQFFGNF
jgi:hypothetical protein